MRRLRARRALVSAARPDFDSKKNAQPEGCAQEKCLEGYRPLAMAIVFSCVWSARPTYILYDW